MNGWEKTTVRPLKRGINLSHWYGQVNLEPGQAANHFDTHCTNADFALLADGGFDHVRLPIDFARLAPGGTLDAEFANRIAASVTQLHEHGLAVIIDAHPELEYKHRLRDEAAALTEFVATWHQFTQVLHHLDPRLTALEILNEPSFGDAARWQECLLAGIGAVREVNPTFTVIVSGDGFSEVPKLLSLNIHSISNLIANIHLYDPMVFSHQGAAFLGNAVSQVSDLIYPFDPTNVRQLMAGLPAATHQLLEDYARHGWDREAYRTLIEPTVAWAKSHGYPLMCNEFGVYRHAPRGSKYRWLQEITQLLAEFEVGWTLWDYAGEFGIASGDTGAREIDEKSLIALGLLPIPAM